MQGLCNVQHWLAATNSGRGVYRSTCSHHDNSLLGVQVIGALTALGIIVPTGNELALTNMVGYFLENLTRKVRRPAGSALLIKLDAQVGMRRAALALQGCSAIQVSPCSAWH